MITVLSGDNSFEIDRYLASLVFGFAGQVEKYDGASLELSGLPDIIMSTSLFADKRLIIVRDLGSNKSIWPIFKDWIGRLSDDIALILIEPKLDKRTLTYKALVGQATIKEFKAWTDRDLNLAEKWVQDEAARQGLAIDKNIARALVAWVGLDQWQLFYALQKLALVDAISVDVIHDIIEPNPVENVFNLFETALKGDVVRLHDMIKIFEQSEDVYRLIGLLSTQVFQLAAVTNADPSVEVAKDFAIHPFVVSKLSAIAKRLGKTGVAKIVVIFAALDDDIKISRAEPWLLLERALLQVSAI